MALQRLRGVGVGSATTRTKRVVSYSAFGRKPQQVHVSKPEMVFEPLASHLLAAGLAIGITLSGATPVMAASPYNSLADIVRDPYGRVDANNDGVITKDELIRLSKEVAEDVDFELPDDGRLDFTMRLYDLNQDGTLATDELLASIALDGAVGENAIDKDVLAVFDKDRDGAVSLSEFKAGLPSLGPNGEAAKEFIFTRVDNLVDGNKKLGLQEFGNALVLTRTAVLGY